MRHSLSRLRWATVWIAGLAVLLSGCASAPGEHAFRQRLHTETLATTSADDVRAEIRFGRDVAARVLGRFPLEKDASLTRYVNLVGTALAAQAGRPELSYHFAVLDSDTVNAYSAPGGYVFITRGALAMAQDEAELAAVLAHEIAHVSERHIVNALNIRARDSSGAAGVGKLLGAGSDTTRVAFMQALDQAVQILFETGYSHRDELEADRVATLLLLHIGLDPLALRRYLARLNASDAGARAVSNTHPPSAARMQALDRLIKEEQLAGLALASNTQRFERYVKAH